MLTLPGRDPLPPGAPSTLSAKSASVPTPLGARRGGTMNGEAVMPPSSKP